MRVCCENGKPLCEMPTLDKLACRHDNCTGPVELEDYLLSSHGTFDTNDCTSSEELCKLLKTNKGDKNETTRN